MRTTVDLIDAMVQMNIILPAQRNELIRRVRANGGDDIKLVEVLPLDPMKRGENKP